jgi:hypothetical protein
MPLGFFDSDVLLYPEAINVAIMIPPKFMAFFEDEIGICIAPLT